MPCNMRTCTHQSHQSHNAIYNPAFVLELFFILEPLFMLSVGRDKLKAGIENRSSAGISTAIILTQHEKLSAVESLSKK